MSIRKQNKVNYFRLKWSEQKETFKLHDQHSTHHAKPLSSQPVEENLTLTVFVQLLVSKRPGDNDKGLRSMSKLIRDEKENPDNVSCPTNFQNPVLAPLFQYLKQSPQCIELFNLWALYTDKPDLYVDVFSHLLELIAMVIVINDDPTLARVNKHITETITEKNLASLVSTVMAYETNGNISLSINTFRVLSALVQYSVRLAKLIQSKFPFNAPAFEQSLSDMSALGAYHGTRPFVIRFILAFFKHQNYKLTTSIVASRNILNLIFNKLNYDHHYVVLDVIEAMDKHVLKPNLMSRHDRLKLFTGQFLTRVTIAFAKEDMPDDVRDAIATFLTILCTSSTHGMAPSDPRWHWFRDDQDVCNESTLIFNVLSSLEPHKFQQHHALFIKIINSCPDLFFKFDLVHPSLNMLWFNRSAMFVKILMTTVPRQPRSGTLLLGGIPSSPLTLISMLIPPHMSNFNFGFDLSPFVTYNQSLIYLLCLRRVNSVIAEMTQMADSTTTTTATESYTGAELESFIGDLKQGIKERMLPLLYFKDNAKQFKVTPLVYAQYISILAEYTKFFGVNEFLPIRLFDLDMIQQSDALVQKHFIHILSTSKTFQRPSQIFTNLTENNESIFTLVLRLYLRCRQSALRSMYHQLLYKLLSINNFFAGVDHEIDCWIENVDCAQSLPFFVNVLHEINNNKFNYLDICQRVAHCLNGGGSNDSLVSPVLMAAISLYLSMSTIDDQVSSYLAKVLVSIGSNSSSAQTIMALIHLLHQKKTIGSEFSVLDTLRQSPTKAQLLKQPKDFKLGNTIMDNVYQFLVIQARDGDQHITQDDKSVINQSGILVDNVNVQWKHLSEKDTINILKHTPIIQILSHLSVSSTKDVGALFDRCAARMIIANNIEQLPPRRMVSIIPLMTQLVAQHIGSETISQFHFDLISIMFDTLISTKSAKAIKLADDLLQSAVISKRWASAPVTQLLMQLLMSNDEHCFNVARQPASAIITQFIQDLKSSKHTEVVPDSFKAIQSIIPFVDFETCLDIMLHVSASTQKSPQLHKLFVLMLHTLSQFSDFRSCQPLVETLSRYQLDVVIPEQLLMLTNNTQSSQHRVHSTTYNNDQSVATQRVGLYKLLRDTMKINVDAIVGAATLDNAILHLLLSSLANPSVYHHATLVSIMCENNFASLTAALTQRPTDARLMMASIVLLNLDTVQAQRLIEHIAEQQQTLKAMLSSNSKQCSTTNIISSLYCLFRQFMNSPCAGMTESIKVIAKSISVDLFDLYKRHDILASSSSTTTHSNSKQFIRMAIQLVQFLFKQLDHQSIDVGSLSSPLQIVLTPQIDSRVGQAAKLYINNLKQCLKDIESPLVDTLYTELFPTYSPHISNGDCLDIVKLSLKTPDTTNLALLVKMMELRSKDDVKDIGNLIHSTLLGTGSKMTVHVWSVLKDSAKRDSIKRYLMVRILYKVYLMNTDLCDNGQHLDHIFEAYGATTHPVDCLLYRIIYLHQVANPDLTESRIGRWGSNYSDNMSFNNMLITNTLFNDKLLEASVQRFPMEAKADMTQELPLLNLDIYTQSLTTQTFKYDPAFLLRLFKSLLATASEDSLNRGAFYTNGPLAFTLSALSSQDKPIRKLAHNVLERFTLLLDQWKTASRTAKDQLRVLKVIKHSLKSKDQHVPPLYTMFLVRTIPLFSKDASIHPVLRFEILTYFQNIQKMDFGSIPFISNLAEFTKSKFIYWILDTINQSLPDSSSEYIIKKKLKLADLLSFFDSQTTKTKMKLKIIDLLTSLAKSGAMILVNNGLLPWMTNIISNGSISKQVFQSILSLLQVTLENIPSYCKDFSEATSICFYLLDYILSIDWVKNSNEFMDIIMSSTEIGGQVGISATSQH
ncbi:hypothetical protein SAMD00019534_118260 [Acytostelium subglobosum LB1]|uniref:hypothetical protein n=1 Tax=Acytostelium subglobosum LB1 TaxID=1410327 RepID=UPI000644E2E0|nr:hypothetical protein SAMD00019534_118260 [Acytostelium subglobosum LB1]GAM28650.1 hypothetical protein SAMD00019534_118260 [Acytostelium subglobosum LB1]|eukprot:XP_012748428.1 hypothetical protein SAMD00019534_118260 [Acytostelium subglobosum LB1]